jgi:hypothetical protein
MEIWKDVIGYAGWYQVSNLGRVRSVKRLTADAVAKRVRHPKHMLRLGSNNRGRLQVTLSKNGVTKRFLVHRLVLAAFAGPCPEDHDGLFRDGNPAKCELDNLRWGFRGTESREEPKKITVDVVLDIRASTESGRALGRRYGVSQATISHIKTKKSWTNV